LAATLLLVGYAAVAGTANAIPADSLQTVHHRVRLEGQGPLTVIFESGLGDTLDVWTTVQAQVSGCTRTLAYTRAGYVGSDPAAGPRDSATIVAELRAELKSRNIGPPYVLVGHSLGGLYMQYFARNYPRETAGLLLLDSTHWNQGLLMDALRPNGPSYFAGHTIIMFMPWIMRRELNDSATAGEQVHDSPQAHDLPTIVLSSTRAAPRVTLAARLHEGELQDEIAADFPGSDHEQVDASGHYIQRDRPDVVVAAVRRLAGCPLQVPEPAQRAH
jgi:pimeloyl-ACP methyl ester carboxylesterase